MPTPWSNEARALFKVIGDRQWHPYGEVLDKVAATVAPGKALRYYERRLNYRRSYSGTQQTQVILTEDERIHFGARAMAERMIQGIKAKNLDFRGNGEDKQIRIRPGVSLWKVDLPPETPEKPSGVPQTTPEAVEASEPRPDTEEQADDVYLEPTDPSDTESAPSAAVEHQHDHWCHDCEMVVVSNVQHGRETPLFSESEVRHLVREEIRTALDEFQSGMQQWLSLQFQQVDRQITVASARQMLHPPGL